MNPNLKVTEIKFACSILQCRISSERQEDLYSLQKHRWAFLEHLRSLFEVCSVLIIRILGLEVQGLRLGFGATGLISKKGIVE